MHDTTRRVALVISTSGPPRPAAARSEGSRVKDRGKEEEGKFRACGCGCGRPAGHGRALLPRAPAPGLLLPHRQDPLRPPCVHRRHPDAAVDGGGDERGRVAAQRQDHEPHRAGGLRDRRVRQDLRHPPHQAGDVRQAAVAGGVQGAPPPGAPPHPRPPQRRARVPEGQSRHPEHGHLPAHRRERVQLGPDGEGQVGAGAEAAGARPVPGGGARARAQGGARDQGLRQLQPRHQRHAPAAVGRRRRGAAADVRAQPLALRAGPAVEGERGRRGRGRGEADNRSETRAEGRARGGGGGGSGAGGASAPPPPVPRLRAAAAAGGDAAAQPAAAAAQPVIPEFERDDELSPVLYCTTTSMSLCVVKKKAWARSELC